MKIFSKSTIGKTGLILALAFILCLAMVIPALAVEGARTPAAVSAGAKNLVKGKVASIADDQKTFEVLTANGNIVVISVDNNTQYYRLDQSAPVIAQIKEKAQAQIKKRLENVSNNNNQLTVSNQRGKNEDASVANKKMASPAVLSHADDVDIDYEEDPAVEELLAAESPNVSGTWGKLKSVFNRSPKAGQKGDFTDLSVGDGVVVKVMPNENLAKEVLIIKVPSVKIVKGEITEVTAVSFTVTPKNSETEPVTLKWDANSRIVIKGAIALAPGQYAVVVYRKANMTVRMAEVFPSAPVRPVVSSDTNARK